MKEKGITQKKSSSKFNLFRIVAVLLAFMMFISVFAGCRKDGESESTASAAKSSTATASKATATASKTAAATANASSTTKNTTETGSNTQEDDRKEVSEADNTGSTNESSENNDNSNNDVGPVEEAKTYNLNGRVLKLITSSKTLGYPDPEGGTRVTEVMYKLMKEAEEKFNCKFEFEFANNISDIARAFESAMLAGVYYADAVRMNRATAIPKHEVNNLILAVNDYIDLNKPVFKMYDQINGLVNPDKIYAFYILTILTPRATVYNKEILTREGLPDLHDLVANGNWNWDTFVDIAVRTTKDLDGDGIIDLWGIGASSAQEMCISMLYSNLASMVERSADGRYVYNLQSPKALKSLQLAGDLYHTYKVTENRNMRNDFINGKVTMIFEPNASNVKSQYTDKGMTNVGCEILPLGPDNPGNRYMREQGSHMWFFPSNISDPEAVINAMAWWQVAWDDSKSDYLTFEDMNLSQAQTWLGATSEPEKEVNCYMNDIRNATVVYDYVEYFSPSKSTMNSKVFSVLAKQQKSPAADIESIKFEIQGVIDEIMGY